MIIAKDIEDVGLAIGLAPTESAVTYVLKNYKSAQKKDPTATWDLVVENLLNEYYWENEPPRKTPCNSHYFETFKIDNEDE